MELMVGQGPPYDSREVGPAEGRTESSCSSLRATKRQRETGARVESMVGQGPPYDSREVGQPEGLSESSCSSLRATKRQGETGATVELMVGQGPPYDSCEVGRPAGLAEGSCSSLQATKRHDNTETSLKLMVGQGPPYDSREVGRPAGLAEGSCSSLQATKRHDNAEARLKLMVGQGPSYDGRRAGQPAGPTSSPVPACGQSSCPSPDFAALHLPPFWKPTMPYRLTLLFLLVITCLPAGARALDWSTSLVPPQGPLPVLLGQAQELSDGSVLLAGEGETGFLTSESARVRIISRVAADGSVLWTTNLGPATSGESTVATAVVELSGGKLVVAFTRRVYAVDGSTGLVLWQHQLSASVQSLQAAPGGNVYAVGEVLVFPFSQTPYAALLSGSDGLTLWTLPASSPSPVLTYFKAAQFSNGDLLAVGSRGVLVRVSSADGSLIWQTAGATNTPIPSAARVAIDEQDRIALFHGGSGGGLELRAGSDGSLIWSLSEGQSLQSHTPLAVWIAQGNAFTVSFIPGATAQVYLRSFRVVDGSENWRLFASEAITGPRFPRSARLSPDTQRIAVLLANSQFRDTQFGANPGRRLLLVNAGTGNLVSSTGLPAGSEAQFADELTWTAAQGLALAGVRDAASGQPALLLTRFDTTAATVGASTVVQASGYAEFTSGGLTLSDGSSVVLSRRGGLGQQVLALIRLDAEGEQLWRTEHLPQTGSDWSWVDAKQVDESSLVGVLSRSSAQEGEMLRVDLETGEVTYVRPVLSGGFGTFRPAVLEVDPGRSRVLIGGSRSGGGVLAWYDLATGKPLWSGFISSPEFGTTSATIRQAQRLADGGALVLSRVFASENLFTDILHRFNDDGSIRWIRSFGATSGDLDRMLVDESAQEARIWGRSGPPPFFVRELTVSLTDGATLATQSLECSGSGTTSSGWVFRLGAQLVHLLECPATGTPGYRLWTRTSWSAAPSAAQVAGLPAATTIRQAAAGSEGRLNVTLGTSVAGASPSVARLSIAGARVLAITPLQTSDGQPFSNPSLIGSGSTAIVAGGHQAFERPRIVVGASRDVALFGDGFEN